MYNNNNNNNNNTNNNNNRAIFGKYFIRSKIVKHISSINKITDDVIDTMLKTEIDDAANKQGVVVVFLNFCSDVIIIDIIIIIIIIIII